MSNPDVAMTIDEGVAEVFSRLTGLELQYDPAYDRWRAVARAINRGLRAVAREREWVRYFDEQVVGTAAEGVQTVRLRASSRPRITGDDAVRLLDENDLVREWAFFLPRSAIEKYRGRRGLWVAHLRDALRFSRPFTAAEDGLKISMPTMREPRMIELPPQPKLPSDVQPAIPQQVLDTEIDFDYPDLVVAKACYFYAQSDPVMQPRVQQLDAEFKDLYYALNEQEDRSTDSPFLNEFTVPIQSDIYGSGSWDTLHPHGDERR